MSFTSKTHSRKTPTRERNVQTTYFASRANRLAQSRKRPVNGEAVAPAPCQAATEVAERVEVCPELGIVQSAFTPRRRV